MSYLVTAPCVVAKDQDGRLHHVYEGGVIQWLSDEQATHFLGAELVVEQGAAPAAESVEGGKPETDANKSVLVDWIAANVAQEDGSDYTADELNKLTKPQLWEIIDSVED